MRTVTEFSGSTIQKAHAAKTKLTAEGVAAEALAERLGTEVGVSGERAARLLEAVEAVGADPSRVRLVRVFPAEEQPKGSTKIGEFNYLVDLQPSAPPPGRRDRDRDRGRSKGFGGLGGKPGERGGLAREERGPMPHAGAGWVLTRDPSAPRDDRRGKKGGPKGGKKGPRRGGPPGPRGPKRPAVELRGAPGERPQGPRPPGAEGAQAQPGDPNAPPHQRRRRRGGRGRGRGPRPMQAGQPGQPSGAPQPNAPEGAPAQGHAPPPEPSQPMTAPQSLAPSPPSQPQASQPAPNVAAPEKPPEQT